MRGSAAPVHSDSGSSIVRMLCRCLAIARVRIERSLSEYQVYPGLVLIQDTDFNGHSLPAITPAQYRVWTASRQKYFDRLAFYRVALEPVSVTPHASKTWEVARASLIFCDAQCAGAVCSAVGRADRDLTSVILSYSAWKKRVRRRSTNRWQHHARGVLQSENRRSCTGGFLEAAGKGRRLAVGTRLLIRPR